MGFSILKKLFIVSLLFIFFFLSGTYASNAYEREIAKLSSAVAEDIVKAGKQTLAVVDFTDLRGNVTELGRFIAEEISVKLAGAGQGFEVMERNQLKKIIQEHKLGLIGGVVPLTTKKIGKLAGVDVLITGTITPIGDIVRLSVKILDTTTALIIGASAGNIPKINAIAELLEPGIVVPLGNNAGTPPQPVGKTPGKAPQGKRFTNSLGMEFVWIPPGNFMMGSLKSEPGRADDETLHEVTLTKGFYLQTTEVTQGQWKAVMGKNPSCFKKGAAYPVERVSWEDCREFIMLLNRKEGTDTYRLPTEAEWEYACRAGTRGPFYTGACLSTAEAHYDGRYPLPGCPKGTHPEQPMPVKSFVPNAWGLYDMHGNVWEWCADWYGAYPGGSVSEPMWPLSEPARVLRGGCWYDSARSCRSANRANYKPGGRYEVRGFRLSRTLEE